MYLFSRFIQLFLIAIPVVVMGWLLNLWVVPSGAFVVEYRVGDSSPFIDGLKPETRVKEVTKNSNGEWVQAIIADPAFFFVHPHKKDFFDQVQLDVWFQNDTLPIVEFGGLSQVQPERYLLHPLHNRLIDTSSWHRIEQDGFVLLQRTQTYPTLAAFFAQPPAREDIAVYRTGLDTPYRMEGYQPQRTVNTIDVSLRGHHEFKTYIKNETLDVRFEYMDMNRQEGEDVVRVTVFNENGQPVAEARASDDGNTSNDAVVDYGLKSLSLNAYGLPEGVYKVVMSTTNDVFFRKIHTPQQKIVFLNQVFVGDEVGYREPAQGAVLYTESKRLRFQTRHSEGVQTISVGDQSFTLLNPYEWYTQKVSGQGVEKVTLPKGNVEVVSEGLMAFAPEHYFSPDPVALNAFSTIEQLGVDYVLANYTSPRQEGDWLVATMTFDVDALYEEDQTWKFSFSTPFIEEFSSELLIHRIRTVFSREDL